MPLIPTRDMLLTAYEHHFAVGAFNVNDMEILQGIVEAGLKERAPLILQVSAGARKYARHEYLIKLVEAALQTADIPIALHLDHGEDFEVCKQCVDGGFTSVMIDGSRFPFEENVKVTKQVVDYAHAKGVSVEGELGKLAGIEDAVKVAEKDALYTDPDEAKAFVERTGVDSLAIAIGTSHGAYKFKSTPALDFERLRKVAKLLPGFPIVLHGASSVPAELVALCNKFGGKIPGAQGVPEAMITEAAKMGVCKVNIDTDLRLAMTASIRKVFSEHPEEFDPRKYLGPARDCIRELVLHKLRMLGASGKADLVMARHASASGAKKPAKATKPAKAAKG